MHNKRGFPWKGERDADGFTIDTMETNVPARVWRFKTLQEAQDYAMFLAGHWKHVRRCVAMDGPNWLVFAWN